jgi:dienelactone hydrolase
VPLPLGAFRRALLGALVFSSLACDHRSSAPAAGAAAKPPVVASPTLSPLREPPSASPTPPASPVAAAPRKLPPLDASEPFALLKVPGYREAVVSLPRGAREKRPVVIATHGNYDRPEWQCEVWREIVEARAFVLCPRGVARPDSPSPDDIRFTYDSNLALERELDAALGALRERFADYVDDSHLLYTGFSLGAIMGVPIAARAPARYGRLVLTEGGHDKWTPDAVKAFAAGGGERVLFVCSQAHCANDARRAGARLEKAGVAIKVVRGPDVGHRYDGPTAAETKKALAWVLEGREP